MLKTEDNTFQKLVEQALNQRGYSIVEKLGDGCTSEVYELEYVSGSLKKRRVGKVPKSDLTNASVTTRINLSKGDLNDREILALNRISHSNIIEVYDAFKLSQSQTVIIEEHFQGINLEELVNLSGPITNPRRFGDIFSQVIAGLKHLYSEERLLHRDIKPGNILIGKKTNNVKISDLQNAGRIDDIAESLLPTRGGTPYTHPFILNALLNGKESRASLESDAYALGATMYFALTGEELFNRKLCEDKNSTQKVDVEGITIGLKLTENGKSIRAIDSKKHDSYLKKKLKKVPRRYRDMLWNLLQSNSKIVNHSDFYSGLEGTLNKITGKSWFVPWKSIKKYTLGYLIGATVLTGLIGGLKLIQLQERFAKKTEPSVFEMLLSENFEDAGIDFLVANEQDAVRENLKPYFKDIKENAVQMNERYSDILSQLEFLCNRSSSSRRMLYSLIRSILMQGGEYTGYSRIMRDSCMDGFNLSRYSVTLVPYDYAIRQQMPRNRFLNMLQNLALSDRYLKHCIGSNQSLADIYALYLSDSNDEIFRARVKADDVEFFPRTIQESGGKKKSVKGYGIFLPRLKYDIISRAMAFYYITDNTGEIHLELLDSNNMPINGLAAK